MAPTRCLFFLINVLYKNSFFWSIIHRYLLLSLFLCKKKKKILQRFTHTLFFFLRFFLRICDFFLFFYYLRNFSPQCLVVTINTVRINNKNLFEFSIRILGYFVRPIKHTKIFPSPSLKKNLSTILWFSFTRKAHGETKHFVFEWDLPEEWHPQLNSIFFMINSQLRRRKLS